MSTGNFTVTRTINATEYKYKIITAGSKFAVPAGMPVTVSLTSSSQDYRAKMHSKTAGRIDGLAEFYRVSNLQAGDEITLSYDAALNRITVSLSVGQLSKPAAQKTGNDVFKFDLSEKPKSAGIAANANECKVEENSLGIIDSESWKNLPYKSYLPARLTAAFTAASDGNYVVIVPAPKWGEGKKIYVFDRNAKKCRYITPVLDARTSEQFRSDAMRKCEIMDGFLYWTDGREAYKTSLTDGATEVVYQLRGYSADYCRLEKMWDGSDSQGAHAVYCTNTRYSDKSGLVRTIIINVDNSVELANIPAKYGNVIGIGEQRALLSQSYDVYDIYNRTVNSIFAYAFESSAYDNVRSFLKRGEKDFQGNVYAVDLHTHTVVIRDYPELQLNGYREGALIIIGKKGARRMQNVYRGRNCANMQEWLCDVYRDCMGHEFAINTSYDFVYRNPDGPLVKLFATSGTGVPESYTVVDNHTAVVKVAEGKIAVVDFAENMRYTINL